MPASDWQLPLLNRLFEIATSRGMVKYVRMDLETLLDELLIGEEHEAVDKRFGFWKLRDFTQRGRSRFLNQLRPRFEEYQKSYERQNLNPLKSASEQESSHVVLSLFLDKCYPVNLLNPLLQQFVNENLGNFSAQLLDCVHVHDNWFDIRVVLAKATLPELYKHMRRVDWIVRAISKPVSQFGQRTTSMITANVPASAQK